MSKINVDNLQEEQDNIITVNDEHYELKFNIQTLKTVERISDKSLMSEINTNNALLGLGYLEVLFSNALYKVDGGKVSPQQAMKIYEALLENKGYVFVNMLVVNQIMEDCGFFFQNA